MSNPISGTPSTEAADLAAQRASTKSTAQSIAHTIATKLFEGTPQDGQAAPKPQVTLPTPDATPQAQPQAQAEPVTPTPQAAAPAGQPAAAVEPAVEEPLSPELEELNRAIEEAALDLGVHPRDVPVELLPAFEKMVQSTLEIRAAAQAERQEAMDQVEQVQEFARQLKESPDRLLLTLAVSNPEIFSAAIETFNEMQNNPKYKDMVVRELQSEARLREAERRERVFLDSAQRERATKVIHATKVASRKHGVPYEVAEQIVASTITANQGRFEPAQVEGVVSKLATDLKARGFTRTATPRVATPAKVAAQGTAPNSEVGGAAAPPAAQGSNTASAGLTETTPHGRLRSIIRGVTSRMRPDQQ